MRILLLFMLISPMAFAQMPTIQSVALSTAEVPLNDKLELILDLTATYTNPYDYDQVVIRATFNGPSGQEIEVDGFFMRDYTLNETTGSLTPVGNGIFKVRFAPNAIGAWTCEMTVTDQNGTGEWEEAISFNCVPATNPENKGFIRANQSNYLHFDNEEQYIPIGENIAWQNTNAFLNYRDWLTALSENGGNFFRLWHAHWGLGIEWENGWNGFQGLRRYKETNAWYQDWLYDFCAENDLYVMLCLQHHGPVSTQVNPNWNDSPYNLANGGPCENTWEFFTDPLAKAHTKNRLRYIVARWGYSRNILCWELFNEVDWTDDFTIHQSAVAGWHAEMAQYLKAIDPYQHLVTTSFAEKDYDPAVWANPDMDFTQTHFYINSSNLERALVGGIQTYLEDYEKPTLTGEFGLGISGSLTNIDPDGIYIHNSLWATLMGGGMGSAMTWWWDNYIHPRDLYYHFAPVAQVANDIPFLTENMRPTSSYAIGAPGNLGVTPTLGWGGIGESTIIVNENGTLTPANPGLSIYLYGSEWNTQFRSPPTFEVNYPTSGQFSVKTNNDSGTDPQIAIYLDGAVALQETALTNQTYSINVPAGNHSIKVDNTGTDWITIASYTFEGLGSRMDTYVLNSENQETLAGWVLNNSYNHQYLEENGEPESIQNGQVVIADVASGSYLVNWYDCLTGSIVQTETSGTSGQGDLVLPVPELYWDLAFYAVRNGEVKVGEVVQAIDFQVYPNPVLRDGVVSIQSEESAHEGARVTLLDEAGKPLKEYIFSGGQQLEILLSGNLPAGFYWLKVENSGKTGTKPIVITSP